MGNGYCTYVFLVIRAKDFGGETFFFLYVLIRQNFIFGNFQLFTDNFNQDLLHQNIYSNFYYLKSSLYVKSQLEPPWNANSLLVLATNYPAVMQVVAGRVFLGFSISRFQKNLSEKFSFSDLSPKFFQNSNCFYRNAGNASSYRDSYIRYSFNSL